MQRHPMWVIATFAALGPAIVATIFLVSNIASKGFISASVAEMINAFSLIAVYSYVFTWVPMLISGITVTLVSRASPLSFVGGVLCGSAVVATSWVILQALQPDKFGFKILMQWPLLPSFAAVSIILTTGILTVMTRRWR